MCSIYERFMHAGAASEPLPDDVFFYIDSGEGWDAMDPREAADLLNRAGWYLMRERSIWYDFVDDEHGNRVRGGLTTRRW